ncbi:MAG: Flp pilus assembly complex ATPase component TadA [Elusimicrobia bacterium]|nr:Flp pilus assembly complex ATPase component TadA [Elusimicrobiota bacterium]
MTENGAAVVSHAARLGAILLDAGVVDKGGLARALERCAQTGEDLPAALAAIGLLGDEDFLKTVSLRLGVPYFTSLDAISDGTVSGLLTEGDCRRLCAVPVVKGEDAVTVAMIDPLDEESLAQLRTKLGAAVLPLLTTRASLDKAVDRLFGVGGAAPADLPVEDFVLRVADPATGGVDEASAISAVDSILREGYARKASDIHVEAARDKVRVRYRIDGVLHDAHALPKEAESSLVARIKILSKLDITETRVPQDGRFRQEIDESTGMDVRVSTLPSIYGEKVTMRLLISGKLKKVEELGMDEEQARAFRSAIHQPNGLVLVTGPTGSGKTSSLYSALAELNTPEVNIVTLEDPVEYRLDRLIQVEANPKAGLSFAVGLRAILRQDPNVVLVGEIRDAETAEIATQAAVTGHLVMSTLHTNDSVAAVHRLLNMGVPPYLLAASLRLVVAQRLLRRLCESCRRPAEPTEDERFLLGPGVAGKRFMAAAGCEDCFKTGYVGRAPVFELFSIGAKARDGISRGAGLDELRAAAEADGMTTLQQSALALAATGATSLAEVVRVTRGDS